VTTSKAAEDGLGEALGNFFKKLFFLAGKIFPTEAGRTDRHTDTHDMDHQTIVT